MKPVVLSFPDNEILASSLVLALSGSQGSLETRHFPDGESYVRLKSDVAGRSVVLVCSLDHPDSKILPLIFAAKTARHLNASSIGLVAPYLSYMRQDRSFHTGEAVTSVQFAELLNSSVDWLVTIDPHLHRYHSLDEIYSMPSYSLQAAPLISEWIKKNVPNPLLVGPDMESEQWVSAVARGAGAPFIVLEKNRFGDRDVEVSAPNVKNWENHTPVLVDDIISTARTMIETVGQLAQAGLENPVCIGVHAVFADNAYQDLLAAGVSKVVTCNTIQHESNDIDVSGLFARVINQYELVTL
jgi:ribose-phosphate pyrophosphokinase